MYSILIIIIGAIVGFSVGLTGMGSGALLTPMLILAGGFPASTAVSSGLVASALIKPIGGTVHLRRGHVHWPMVGWICAGSLPAAVAGAVAIGNVELTSEVERMFEVMIGVALLGTVAAIVSKSAFARGRQSAVGDTVGTTKVRPVLTVAIGVGGGLIVALTSVGAGSLMLALLMLAYPGLSSKELVSTSLWQAIPLTTVAAISHTFVGQVDLPLVLILLIGYAPGVYVGARISAGASDRLIRSVLVVVLAAVALKMLGLPTVPVLVVLALGVGRVAWTSRPGYDR